MSIDPFQNFFKTVLACDGCHMVFVLMSPTSLCVGLARRGSIKAKEGPKELAASTQEGLMDGKSFSSGQHDDPV